MIYSTVTDLNTCGHFRFLCENADTTPCDTSIFTLISSNPARLRIET